jgi:xylulokinase
MNGKYLLGFDVGSSSVKAALLNIEDGKPVSMAHSPKEEMTIHAPQPGFAEQDPEQWWKELINAVALLRKMTGFQSSDIAAIGISYQMHGLVCVDSEGKVLRPSIIWCDSRAVGIGNQAFEELGPDFCLTHFLNSPGNFTASKLKWVKDNQPELFSRIHRIMLPGDYIAMRLTGETVTTVSGLSEGIMWNFTEGRLATELLEHYGISTELIPTPHASFGEHGRLSREAAGLLGIAEGIPVSYRAGDQPNNAWSLNVLELGEIAATAGTSGVVYGVTDKAEYDPASRVNSFVHVSYTPEDPRLGILLCINGTGILYNWLRKNVFSNASYEDMNREAGSVKTGSDGLLFYPFGNGAERVLNNVDPGASMSGLQFNRHTCAHMARAAQEGIVFSLYYGITIMKEMGMDLGKIKAGHANMFLSPLFAEAFANTSGAVLELYNTDGAVGAARGAGVGAGIFKTYKEAFRGIEKVKTIEPSASLQKEYADAYSKWLTGLEDVMRPASQKQKHSQFK